MNKKKIIIIISIVVGILLLSTGGYFLYKYIRVKTAKVEVKLSEKLEANFADTLRVSSFIESINGKIVDDYVIDTGKLGKKTINFEFVNEDGIKIKYSYVIDVVDKQRNQLLWELVWTVVVRAVGHDGRHTVCIVESTDEVV